jgi:methyl-accepting chemotaxis protein
MMQMLLQSSDRLAETAQTIHQRSTDQRTQSSEIHLNSNQLASAMQQVTIASRHVSVQAQELLELANVLDQAHPAGTHHNAVLANAPQVAVAH